MGVVLSSTASDLCGGWGVFRVYVDMFVEVFVKSCESCKQ